MDWDRYLYVRNNPINALDPTGHYVCEETECRGYHEPTPPSVPSSNTPPSDPATPKSNPSRSRNNDIGYLINSNPYYLVYLPWLIFPNNEPCLGSLGCWGGIDYAHWMVQTNGPKFDQISTELGGIANAGGYLLDYYENWSGLKINPKIGFGLDAVGQWTDDIQRRDLSMEQRISRSGVVGVEGIGTSALSSYVGQFVGDLALAASFGPSASTDQLWLPVAAYWGGFTLGYGVTNATVSFGMSIVNDKVLFPAISSYVP
jgi:hypothetical protein